MGHGHPATQRKDKIMTQAKHTTLPIQEGDKVRCLADNIDRRGLGKGEIGYVTGFSRFSQYHGREVYVSKHPDGCYAPDGTYDTAAWCGWYWLSDVEKIDGAAIAKAEGGAA